MMLEVQALTSPANGPGGPAPRRMGNGVDYNRLLMLSAVASRRGGLDLAGQDIIVNVAGGFRVSEPAADLAVAAALLSAREDVALPPETVVFGEISLSGALRPVSQTELRLKEAQKLGFSSAIAPAGGKTGESGGMTLNQMGDLTAFVGDVFGAG